MKNYTAIIIDYYLQHVEYGASQQDAKAQAESFAERFQGEIPDGDYEIIMDLLTRIARI